MSTNRVKILEGTNVSLVVPEKQDIDLWYRGVNDIETQSYLGSMFGTIITRESEEEFFNTLNRNDKMLTFSIYVNEINSVIGNISLKDIDYKNKHTELGIAIFDKENQSKGYGTEAVTLIQKYVFEVLGLNKLYLRYIATNQRAGAVYEKLGFIETGRMKDHNYALGEFRDDVLMEIMRSEYDKK